VLGLITVSRRSPAISSYLMLSNVHLRLSLRVGGWFVRGLMSESGWDDRVLRWALAFSLNISLTGAMHKSRCTIWFVTYHGACVMSRNIFDWYFCIISMLDEEAQPHNSMPKVHTGLRITLYINVLFSSDSGECLPSSFLLALQPPLGVVFYNSLVGFSLLAYEVSWSHTTTRHIR